MKNNPTSLQLDSYLLDRLKKITPAQQEKLTYTEWRKFIKYKVADRITKIPLHEKLIMLNKLGVGYQVVLFDKTQDEAINASDVYSLIKNSVSGELVDYAPFFVFGNGETERFLLRLEAMFNSRLYPISGVIKRDLNRDTFRLVEEYTKREEWLSFLLRLSTEVFKHFSTNKSLHNARENYTLNLTILFIFYDVNKPMDFTEIDSYLNFTFGQRTIKKALNGLTKEGLLELSRYPSRGTPNKTSGIFKSYYLTNKGNEKVKETLNEIILKFK